MNKSRFVNLSILYIVNLILLLILCLGISTKTMQNTHADESGFMVEQISTSNEFLTSEYLGHYAYDTDTSKDKYIITYTNNGNNWGSNVLANAFDKNFNTFWETNIVNSNTFKNCVTISFNQSVEADRLIYATRRDDKQKGFPLTATFYISNDGQNFEKIASIDCGLNDNILLYTFDKIYTFSYFRFEYTNVNANKTQHASASEFLLLKPEEPEIVQARNLFVDYKKSQVNPLYTTIEDIVALENSIKTNPIYEIFKDDFIRARQVLNREIIFDTEHREFSTNLQSNSKHLKQVGNVVNYARNTLKMTWMGTNRQVTGINVSAGETITIYVEADSGDPLPSLIFTQHLGYWNKWLSGTYTLSRGANVITAPNLYDSSWSVSTLAGGPIYLVNPYTSNEQSQNVKVYIEGGEVFPVYYLGDDEADYEQELIDYVASYDSQTVQNITEIASDNVILTVQATRAYDYYISNSYSMLQTCNNWDEYLKGLYTFDGISFDPKDEYYKEIANYLNVNVRIMQPYAAAYAYTEHIGIQVGGWQDIALQGSNWGWGMTHEIGHMMDIGERVVGETSNNMISNYNKCANEGTGSRENHSTITQLMAPDDVDPSQVWSKNQGNCAIWWNIESLFPGYWGKLDNLYRYGPSASGMTKAEKQVYYSSIALNIDMSYYFERYGYAFGGTMFAESTASQAFLDAMAQLRESGEIVENPLKFWYLDAMEYNYTSQYGDQLHIYDSNDIVNIESVNKTSAGYSIILPKPTNQIAHLGYEILEGNDATGYKVIAFTSSLLYTDTTSYTDGYVPNYKIRAYDRTLSATALSETYQIEQDAVCVLNDVEYTSLYQAIENAVDGDTIYLIDNINETNLSINKNITISILNDTYNIVIQRVDNNDIFVVESGATLTISGTADKCITIDGFGTSLSGRVANVKGNFNLNYIIVQNVYTSASSPICVQQGAKTNFSNCTFINNRATNGGVFELNGQNTFSSCTFTNNQGSYGGVFILNSGSVSFAQCTFMGNTASAMGGIGFVYGNSTFNNCSLSSNSADRGALLYMQMYGVSIFNQCTIFNNTAWTEGGTVYCNQYGSTAFNNTNVYNNSATRGSALYLNRGSGTYNIGTGKLEGEIYLNTSPTLTLNGNLNESIAFILNTSKALGATVINNNTSMTLQDLDNILLNDAISNRYVLQLSNNNKSIVLGERVFDVFIDNQGTRQLLGQYAYNATCKLPQQIDASNNIKFVGFNYNGTMYGLGEEIAIINATDIKAVFGTLQTLTAVINKKSVQLPTKYIDGDTINLNEIVVDNGYKTVGYIYNNKVYKSTDSIKFASKTLTIEVLVRKAYSIILYYGIYTQTLAGQYIEGDTIDLSKIAVPEYFRLSEWQYDLKKYDVNSTIYMVEGVNKIYAVGESAYKINFQVGNKIHTTDEYYWKGEVFTVPNYSSPFGQTIDGFDSNGTVYNIGDEIVFDGSNYNVVAITHTDWVKIGSLIAGCILFIILFIIVAYIIVKKQY